MKKINYKKIFNKSVLSLVGIGIIIGSLSTIFYYHQTNNNGLKLPTGFTAIHQSNVNHDYQFTKPLLGIEYGEPNQFEEAYPFEKRMVQLISNTISDDPKETISVYFRDLTNGSWIGVNEDAQYSPASLLKVPILIAYYKQEEVQPDVLTQQIAYNGPDLNAVETIKPTNPIQIGKLYTVDQMIEAMIKYSDNNAASALFSNANQSALKNVFTDLGINIPDTTTGTSDFITTKSYALFFRILYNSTYLTSDYSEQALKLLSESDVQDGIVGGLSSGTVFSHKFGEREVSGDQNLLNEFHDCGIVYAPNHPYLLCIMTKGSDINSLKDDVKAISKVVYQEVINNTVNK